MPGVGKHEQSEANGFSRTATQANIVQDRPGKKQRLINLANEVQMIAWQAGEGPAAHTVVRNRPIRLAEYQVESSGGPRNVRRCTERVADRGLAVCRHGNDRRPVTRGRATVN